MTLPRLKERVTRLAIQLVAKNIRMAPNLAPNLANAPIQIAGRRTERWLGGDVRGVLDVHWVRWMSLSVCNGVRYFRRSRAKRIRCTGGRLQLSPIT